MPELETNTRTITKLRKQLDDQASTVGKMRTRISSMSDEISDLKSDISNFKKFVAKDMQRLVDKIDPKEQ